ncbi:MAG: GNAT family N-acetyltransferase [Coleofasciculus sp. S288]|nr:GNAT family N-acetyltransferase [Coleofasciculus sp. S288]
MYTLNLLINSTATQYEKLTFPIFRSLLHNLELNPSIIAIGASCLGQPIGLAIAQIHPDSNSAEILSLFVASSYRCRGVGTALLTRLESELSQRGCRKAELVYTTGKPTTPALEHLLHKCHWALPQPRMLVCKTTEKMMDAPWMNRYSLPPTFTIFPWTDLTENERLSIQKRQAEKPWIPQDLIPFQYEENLESLNSLGLLYKGEVVGWILTHRIDSNTIRYTCSFVQQEFQRMGRMIPLLVEAIKRQYQAKIFNAIWAVSVNRTAMGDFVKRRMANYMESIEESRGTFKLL